MKRTGNTILLALGLTLLGCHEPADDVTIVGAPFELTRPIVGGQPATPTQIGGTVYISLPDSVCTGTLIAPDVVVTAAHCLTREPGHLADPTETFVVAGAIDVDASLAEQWHPVLGLGAHPSYTYLESGFGVDPTGLGNVYDIGVLVLATPVTTLPAIPVLPASRVDELLTAGTPVIISGYGHTISGGSDSGVLYIATTPYVRRSETEILLGATGNPDTCQGDSGGPAYVIDANQDIYLVGATSRSSLNVPEYCGHGGPSTLVPELTGWLTTFTGGRYQGPEASACAGACGATQVNACTCGASDPCGWQHDGFCDEPACGQLTNTPFDDAFDCGRGGGGEAGVCGGSCDAAEYTACTCGANNPCGWRNDGYCDAECAQVTNAPFDDSGDCGAGEGACGGSCADLLYDACTCGAADPCGWGNDGHCDAECAEVTSTPFADGADCGGGGGDGNGNDNGNGGDTGDRDRDDRRRDRDGDDDERPPPSSRCRCVEASDRADLYGLALVGLAALGFARPRRRR